MCNIVWLFCPWFVSGAHFLLGFIYFSFLLYIYCIVSSYAVLCVMEKMLCAIFCFVYFHTIVCFIRSTFFCCFSAFEPINNGFFSVRIHIHTIFIENRFAHTQQRRQKLGNWHAYNCKKRSKKKSIFFPLFAFKRCWYVYVYVCVSGVRMKSSFPLSLSYGGFVFVVLLIFR